MKNASRLEALERRVAARAAIPPQVVCRAALARSLYDSTSEALQRVLEAPRGPDDGFHLDLLLTKALPGLRAVDLARSYRYPLPAKTPGLIPPVDDRYGPARPNEPIVLPPGEVGDGLLVYSHEPPATLAEAYWLAGTTGDGLYVAMINSERRAIRVEGPTVEARDFGGAWETVGKIEPNEESDER